MADKLKLIRFSDLGIFADELNKELAKKANAADVTALSGAMVKGVKVNGEALTKDANGAVDVTVASGSTNGTVAVNGTDVPVKGLAALAYKESVSKDDLGEAFATEITKVVADVATLNGDATTDGSVVKTVATEIAKVVAGAPESLDTLKEISDWISEHADSAATMNTSIAANTSKITKLLAQLGITDLDATVTKTVIARITEIETKLGDLDTLLDGYVKTTDIETVTEAEIRALLHPSTGEEGA